jgi:large subunit ribosomal protein L6
MPKVSEVNYTIDLPEGVDARLEGHLLSMEGPKGAISREFRHPKIDITIEDGLIRLQTVLPRRKLYALIGTWRAHLANMARGVSDGYMYILKIRYSHFPMKVHVKDGDLVIENFMGERHPRRAPIIEDTEVSVKGDEVTVTGIDKEHVGQTAANIELATKIRRYDPKVFQDGIYIVEKG